MSRDLNSGFMAFKRGLGRLITFPSELLYCVVSAYLIRVHLQFRVAQSKPFDELVIELDDNLQRNPEPWRPREGFEGYRKGPTVRPDDCPKEPQSNSPDCVLKSRNMNPFGVGATDEVITHS